jgi:acetylglutamate kinase
MKYVEDIARENLGALVDALKKKGVFAKPLRARDRVIIAEDKHESGYGNNNGNIVEVNTAPIFSTIERGYVPIISPIGVSKIGRKHFNLNSASVGAELARAIDPVRYLMVTGLGGVFNDPKTRTQLIRELVLRREYEQMVGSGVLSEGMKKNVDEAMQCLEARANGEDRSVQIVGAGNLLHELFSRKGAGTYIRLGYNIETEPMELFDRSKIEGLVAKVFGSSLKPSFFEETGKQVHLEPDYKGIAIVIENPIASDNPEADLIDYIDILAVNPGFERNGLGGDLVNSVLGIQPKKEEASITPNRGRRRNGHRVKVFWRSKTYREDVNDWYYRISDGHWQYQGKEKSPYNLFWIGLTRDEVGKALAYVRNRPSNFEIQ